MKDTFKVLFPLDFLLTFSLLEIRDRKLSFKLSKNDINCHMMHSDWVSPEIIHLCCICISSVSFPPVGSEVFFSRHRRPPVLPNSTLPRQGKVHPRQGSCQRLPSTSGQQPAKLRTLDIH